MFTFTFLNPKTNNIENHTVSSYGMNEAFQAVNDHMKEQHDWFVNDIDNGTHMWASSCVKPNDFLWMCMPEGINSREWHGLEKKK